MTIDCKVQVKHLNLKNLSPNKIFKTFYQHSSLMPVTLKSIYKEILISK